MVTRFVTFILILTSASLILAACQSDDNDEPDVDELIEQAQETFAETDTARFSLEIDGQINIDEGGMLAITSVEGEVERPDRARVDAGVRFAGSAVTMELIASDGQMYLRNILSGDWERAPSDLQFDPAGILDNESGIGAAMEQITDADIAGDESVNGVDSWHVTGSVQRSALEALTGPFFESDELDIELWIAKEDHRLMRVILHDEEATDGGTWELNLTDHNDEIEISAPEIS